MNHPFWTILHGFNFIMWFGFYQAVTYYGSEDYSFFKYLLARTSCGILWLFSLVMVLYDFGAFGA